MLGNKKEYNNKKRMLSIKDNDFFKDINPYLDGIYENCELGLGIKTPGYVYPKFPDPLPTPEPEPTPDVNPYIYKYWRSPDGYNYIDGFDWEYINSHPGSLPDVIVLSPVDPDGLAVNSVAMDAFQRENINRDVVIPFPISNVGSRNIFMGTGITKLTFNDNISGRIGPSAFSYTNIGKVTIPSKITDIANSCFSRAGLEELNFTKNSQLKIIDSSAFSYNYIKEVILPSNLETMGVNCFQDNELEKIVIPSKLKHVTGLRRNSFIYLYIPGTVLSVNELSGNKSLTHLDLENGVEEVTGYFDGCNQLKHIRIPDSISSFNGNIEFDTDGITRNIYANLLPGDITNEDRTRFTLRGAEFRPTYGVNFKLKPLNEFPRDQSKVY